MPKQTEEIPAAAPAADETVNARAALIAKKRLAGLTKDQAETVVDAQLAHDAKLAESTKKTKAKAKA